MMKKMMNWVFVATLVCSASLFTACSVANDDNVKAWLDDELIFDEMLKPLR